MDKTINLKAPIIELVEAVQQQKLSAVDLVRASLDMIKQTDNYHAILEVSSSALAEASDIDRRIAAGEDVGILAGIPFIAKDNFLTKATHTTAGSKILEPFRSPYDADVIKRLKDSGAIMVAKSNLDSFAHGSSTENSDFGPTKNPVDPSRVPGGSSGGSAAAVALGQACFALGTDTGGSIRLPASYCGVVGLKPTYGLVPRQGVVAMGSSVDVIGPITNSVEDAAIVLDVIAGKSQNDPTSIERDASYSIKPNEYDIKPFKVGVIAEYLESGLDKKIKESIEETIKRLKKEGVVVETISLESIGLSPAVYYILVPAEISSNLARYDGIKYGYSAESAKDLEETYRLSRDEGFGQETKRRILMGTYVLSSGYYDAYYKQAQLLRTKLVKEFRVAFSKYDFLIGPTAPTPAFKLGEKSNDPLSMYLNDVATVAANLVGVPSISIPLGNDNGLPYGLQIMADQRHERKLLEFSAAVERMIV